MPPVQERDNRRCRRGKDQSLDVWPILTNSETFQSNLKAAFLKHIDLTIHPFSPSPGIWWVVFLKAKSADKCWEQPEKAEDPGTQISQEHSPRGLPGKPTVIWALGRQQSLGSRRCQLSWLWTRGLKVKAFPSQHPKPFFPRIIYCSFFTLCFPHVTVITSFSLPWKQIQTPNTKHPLWPSACTPSHQHCTDTDMGHLEVLSLLGMGLGGLEPGALWVLTCVWRCFSALVLCSFCEFFCIIFHLSFFKACEKLLDAT